MSAPPSRQALEIGLDPKRNRLLVAGQSWQGTGRWEALFLLLLVQAGPAGLDKAMLGRSLLRAGQQQPLDRTGMRRLLLGTQRLLQNSLGEARAAARVRWAPRAQTVGPWYWVCDAMENWRDLSQPLPRPSAEDGLPVASERLEVLPALARHLLKSDCFGRDGNWESALYCLGQARALPGLSPEMRAVLDMRQAKWLKRGGDQLKAIHLLRGVRQQALHHGFGDPALAELAHIELLSCSYQLDVWGFKQLLADLSEIQGQPQRQPHNIAQAANLKALLLRRQAQQAMKQRDPARATKALHDAGRQLAAALYQAWTQRDHEYAQNYLFNLALVQTDLGKLGECSALDVAFDCYCAVLLGWDEIELGGDATWDYIGMAQLWLDNPERRTQFSTGLAYGDIDPSKPSFYLRVLDRAKQLGEPRQRLHAAVVLGRFANETDDRRHRQHLAQAIEEFRAVIAATPDLAAYCRESLPGVLEKWSAPS